MRRVVLIIALLATGAACCDAGLSSPAAVTCPRLATAPTIDGTLNEGEWARAAMAGPFILEADGVPSLRTEAWLGYDETALYVAAQMQEPMPLAVQCAAAQRDGAVTSDDSLTIVLDPENDGESVITLAVNPEGTEYDAIDGDTQPTIAWDSATAVGESAWVVEAAYLFGAAGAPEVGAIWGLNIRRHAPRIAETSSMTGEAGAVGSVSFGRPALRCEVPPIGDPWYGSNTTDVALRNLDAEPQTVKLNVRVSGPTRRAHFFDVQKLTLGSGEARTVPVTWQVNRGGRCSVELSVQVVEGTTALTALRTAQMPFELAPLGATLDEAVERIAKAYRTYVFLPEDARPFDGASRLTMLLGRWRYLDSQQQRRASLTPEEVLVLLGQAKRLVEDAILLQREMAQAAP
ncbi:MAG: hypothetical protein ACP5KN_02490 [Armatimonadota bacterium]